MRKRSQNGAEGKREKQAAEYQDTVKREDVDAEEIAVRKTHRRREFRLTGSMTAKIIAFFLLATTCFAGLGIGLLCLYMEKWGLYTEELDSVLLGVVTPQCQDMAYTAECYIGQGNMKAVAELCGESGVDMQLIYVDDASREKVLWDSGNGEETNLFVDFIIVYEKETPLSARLNGYTLEDGEWYLLRIYMDPDFPQENEFGRNARLASYLYGIRYLLIALAAAGIFLCLNCFLFLMCSAGHRNGREGIVPGALTSIHMDVLTVIFGGVALAFTFFLISVVSHVQDIAQMIMLALGGAALAVWMTFYFMDFALRVKRGKCWRYSLVYITLRWFGRGLYFLCRELAKLLGGIPLVMTTVIVFLGICILEFVEVLFFVGRAEDVGMVLWIVEKTVLLFAVIYIALVCRELLKASCKLADGEDNYRVDTSRMFGAFREHGEKLNSLGMGIAKAVEARTKSERMKTELISNVSHDLKTPLTSIINYADLIWEEPTDNEKIKEYAEVLLRQSGRLKKLLEDLVEASKATTGNLEVNLEPCEAGVLLSQAAGEYQQRMEEKQLELITRQPEEAVMILADGRRLWRVFENLLNNICKYAQENSRVYLNVEVKEKEVQIIFRNMSMYPLDISAEELEERFVRGDRSRHMEGNGLGLSITKSLVELQNGRMEIVIDGDLFKVVLCFPLYS